MCNTLDMDMKGGWMEYATTYDDFFFGWHGCML